MSLIEREALVEAVEASLHDNPHTDKKIHANHIYEHQHMLRLIDCMPPIDPIRAAGGCRCGECRFEEDCEKQVTIIRRDHVLEQNVYEHRRVEWCGAGEPKEAQDDG